MTQKELSYVEDAIEHEKNIISIIDVTLKKIENENLINFFDEELKLHEETKEKLINMMEEKAHEW